MTFHGNKNKRYRGRISTFISSTLKRNQSSINGSRQTDDETFARLCRLRVFSPAAKGITIIKWNQIKRLIRFSCLFYTFSFFLSAFLSFSPVFPSCFPLYAIQNITERKTSHTRSVVLCDSSSLEDANCKLGTRMLHLWEQRHFIVERERKERLANRKRPT